MDEWRKHSDQGDPSKNVILESAKDYIVIRNTTAKTEIPIRSIYMNASAFSSEAKNFCAKHDMSHEKIENFDEHTAAYYCYKTIAQMLNLPKNETSDSEMYHICYRAKKISDMEMYKYYGCKSIVKRFEKKYPMVVEVEKKFYDYEEKFKNSTFVFELKKRALAKKDETDKIEMASMVKKAQATCKDLGFKKATPEYANCSLKLYTQSVELAAKNKQQIVHTQVNTSTGNAVSSGSNSVTIYDPVRDANRAIDRGMKMITGKCNDLAC